MKIFKKLFNVKVIALSLLLLTMITFSACNATTNTDKTTTAVVTDSSSSLTTDELDIAVTSVVISSEGDASTISALAGTLQMSATVLPANATDASFTWSVVNGTGSATISTTGLVTAEVDGTVTLRATTTNGVYGAKVITISNQELLNMDATLTNLAIEGNTVLGFNPMVMNYVHVISDGLTTTPTVTAEKFETTATVEIVEATDITSTEILDRTTTITVTTTDEIEKVYYVVFESQTQPVDLGTAADFVILSETGISTSTTSVITGDIGVFPAAATYITGFSLTMDSSGEFSTSDQIVGNVYSSDYTTPTPDKLTTAIADMILAYSDAADRTANYTELYNGDLSGKTLTSGVFKFGNSVLINTDLTLTGNATDVWIFQIAGNFTMASNINIILAGGADANNIIWQVADTVAIGSGSHLEGTILAMTNVSLSTNSSINGMIYAQTAVTLDAATVTKSRD